MQKMRQNGDNDLKASCALVLIIWLIFNRLVCNNKIKEGTNILVIFFLGKNILVIDKTTTAIESSSDDRKKQWTVEDGPGRIQ